MEDTTWSAEFTMDVKDIATLDQDCSSNFQSQNQSPLPDQVLTLRYLANQPVEVGIAGPLDVQVPPADVVDGLVVHHEGAVGVLEGCVSC